MQYNPLLRGLLSILLTGVLLCFLPATAAAADSEPWNLYFGLLHAHTALSGGSGSVEEAFSQAAQAKLDFFAVTDHSHSFDSANAGSIGTDGKALSPHWATGKAAAVAASNEAFVGIFGYEMAFRDYDGLGHLSTFHTPGWVSRNQEGFSSLEDYYDALTTVSGSVSQFCHPGDAYGDFQNFSHYDPVYDAAISLLEIGSGRNAADCRLYLQALDKGWHAAPTLCRNTHGGNWGSADSGRTVILAETLTESSLYEAMAHRRVYASMDADLEIVYTLNGQIMGSILPFQESIAITAQLSDPTDLAIGTVEVVTGGGRVLDACRVETPADTVTFSIPGAEGYYFLRITQPDGETAVTAPIWVEEKMAPEPEGPQPTPPKPEAPEEPQPPSSEPEETPPDALYAFPEDLGFLPRFGLLHAHSKLSGGTLTADALFAQAAAAETMDFFAVTDHSHSFENADAGSIHANGADISVDWKQGKEAAERATTDDFAAIFGYEMAWPDDRSLGHISTFSTPGWQSRNQEGFSTLEAYYEALAAVPGSVSQFCHPGPEIGEFEAFSHDSAKYDEALSLLELENGRDLAYYIQALDAGWHLAPTAGAASPDSRARTVILSESLTEESLYAAMAARRVYATADDDLSVYFILDGCGMGSITTAGEAHSLTLFITDPTDWDLGAVEILTDGGKTVLSEVLPKGGGKITLTFHSDGSYYFLRIIQADGDIAVTAPVWTESYNDVGISQFSADAQLLIQGQKLNFQLTLFNEESEPFVLEELVLYVGEQLLYREETPGAVSPAQEETFQIPVFLDAVGEVTLRAVVTGTINGTVRSFQNELTLRFKPREMINSISVDLGHSGLAPSDFDNLAQLAAEINLEVTFFDGSLPEGRILILPHPETPYSPDFLQQVKIFCARGGSVVVCGSSGPVNQQSNRLLEALGSTLRLGQDTALDDLHTNGDPDQLYPTVFNRDADWCTSITEDQYYAHLSGCTVSPGKGIWLVKGGATAYSSLNKETDPVLLAWEKLSSGGNLFAAGTLFPADSAMLLPKTIWNAPTANQTILEAILGISRKEFPITDIADVRTGEENLLYRIKGYTTSGTANPYNTFPDTLYLQDDTGGIAIMPFRETGIAVGTALEAVGYLQQLEGNPVFFPADIFLSKEGMYRYVPQTMNHSRLLDYGRYGGQLVQAEAKVISVTLTEDGMGVSRFTLEDAWGDRISVLIEDSIFSGAYGTNTLASEVKIGRTVRAMGLLHLDSNSIPVLRVRNCEEVVWVPPIPRPDPKSNPYTGDQVPLWTAVLSLSLWGLLAVTETRKNGAEK